MTGSRNPIRNKIFCLTVPMLQGKLRRIHVFLDRCAEVYLICIKFITIHEALHLQRDNAQL